MVRVGAFVAVLLVGSLQVGGAFGDGGRDGGKKTQDCVMSAWTPYEPCDAKGWKSHTRMVVVQPSRGGSPCPATMELAKCSTKDCWTSAWAAWACDPLTAMKSRRRTITNRGDTKAKCPLTEIAACDPIPCVINTEQEDLGEYGACVLKKGAWVKSKVLDVKAPPKYGGLCPSERDPSRTVKKPCPTENCVIEDEASARASTAGWSACADKGGGLGWYKTRVLGIVTAEKYGGTCTRSSVASRTIEARCDPVDCVYQTELEARADAGNSFGSCEQLGTTWVKKLERKVTAIELHGGSCPLLGARQVVEPCAPIDCVYQTELEARADTSNSFGLCEQQDSAWVKKKERTVMAIELYGGTCPLLDVRQVVDPCDPGNCETQRQTFGPCPNGEVCGVINPGISPILYGCKTRVTTTVDGSISRTASSVSIDYVDFVLGATSVVDLDTLSMEAVSTGGYVDVNSDCNSGYIDSSIVLMSVNADGSNNQVLAANDNAATGEGLEDGSLSSLDSFLSSALQPGRYRVAVGVSSMTTNQALARAMPLSGSPIECGSYGARYGSYRLTIGSDVAVTVSSPNTYVGSQCGSDHTATPYGNCPYHKEVPVVTTNANNIVEGTIRRLSGGASVDYIKFTMPAFGRILIEANSYEPSSSGAGFIDMNGYCGSAYFDPYAFLFRATPNANTVRSEDIIDYMDDYHGPRVDSRAVHPYDPYLSASLPAGDYVFVIGSFPMGVSGAVQKFNPGGNSILSCGQYANAGNYRVKFSAPFDVNPVSPGSFTGSYCPNLMGQRICV